MVTCTVEHNFGVFYNHLQEGFFVYCGDCRKVTAELTSWFTTHNHELSSSAAIRYDPTPWQYHQ